MNAEKATFCAESDDLIRGKDEWVKIDYVPFYALENTGNGGFLFGCYYLKGTERTLITDELYTSGKYCGYFLDESKYYLFYTTKNEKNEIVLNGVYLNHPESSKVLMKGIMGVLDASDPEHVLVRKNVYEFRSCYYVYDVGFDHDPVVAIEDVYQSWNMNGRIFAVAEGRRSDYSLPGYGDLVEYHHGSLTTVLANISETDELQYAMYPETGGVGLAVENDPDGYVLVEDGSVYRCTSESGRILREMIEEHRLSAYVYTRYTGDGIYVDNGMLIHVPVSEGATTTDVKQVAEYTYALKTINGELYYLRNLKRDEEAGYLDVYGELCKVDRNGEQKVLIEHVWADRMNAMGSLTDDFVSVFELSARDSRRTGKDVTMGVYSVHDDLFLGDYDSLRFYHDPERVGGRVNEEEYIYVAPDGSLYLNRKSGKVILDQDVCGVWTPYTAWKQNGMILGYRTDVLMSNPS